MYHIKFTSVLRILLGTVILNELVRLGSTDFFSTDGYLTTLNHLHEQNFLPISQALLQLFIDGEVIGHMLCPIILLIAAIGAIGGLFVRITNYLLCIIFGAYFIAHTGVKGTWVFEFVLPLVFATLLCWYENHKASNHTWHTDDFSGVTPIMAVVLSISYALVIALINIGANNMPEPVFWSLLPSTLCVTLLLLNCLLSRRAQPTSAHQHATEQPLIDLVTIAVGIMLAAQIHMDYLFKWFTITGYQELIETYAEYATLSSVLSSSLEYIKTHASFFMPLQQAIESFLPLCLIALVLRPIVIVLTTGLLLALAIIELGVPATFPILPHSEHTWAWELMLSALIMLVICGYEWKRFFASNNFAERWFGNALFPHMSWKKRGYSTLVCCIILYAIIFASHNLANVAFIFSFGSTLTVFFYLSLFHMLDHLKTHHVKYSNQTSQK